LRNGFIRLSHGITLLIPIEYVRTLTANKSWEGAQDGGD